jgi:hypothetical protein
MAKFEVGEKCLAYKKSHELWVEATITALPGKYPAAPDVYEIDVPGWPNMIKPHFGTLWTAYECNLRKIPPDSDTKADDTSEDPGLTRIKKLLEQDAVKQPKPVKA